MHDPMHEGHINFNIHLITLTYLCSAFVSLFQVQYLQDFAERLQLNIQYNTEITHVERPDQGDKGEGSTPFLLKDQNKLVYYCEILIVRYIYCLV